MIFRIRLCPPLHATVTCLLLAACSRGDTTSGDATPGEPPASRPADVPALHHVGLNSVDPERAVDWYLRLWPSATRTEIDGRPAVASEMYLVFTQVDDPPDGAFDPTLGRPERQSPFWHIGAFLDTTDGDRRLGALGMTHLPLYTGPDGGTVWRSGLTRYAGIVTAEGLSAAEPAAPRPGGFSYVLAPDGVLFELTGGPSTSASLSHVHLFQEEPLCAANWYVETLGMSLPPIRNEDGSAAPRPPHEPCEAPRGQAGWPSLEPIGTLRQPRAGVVHGNGNMSWYPRQCVDGRCREDRPLVPSRGQVLDHIAFRVEDVEAWHTWLRSWGVVVLEAPHPFDAGRAIMIEGPDGLAIELVDGVDARS
jgi:catechol 2,3-dioxygenase-like lactoylglutathione lyase family enzyme